MKINVTEVITDYEGKPVETGDKRPLTWRLAFFESLNAMYRDEEMSGDQKVKSYTLTKMTFDTDEPDFSVEERAYIIERVKKYYGPLVVGKVTELFNKSEPATTV